jgi:hypothetical protein
VWVGLPIAFAVIFVLEPLGHDCSTSSDPCSSHKQPIRSSPTHVPAETGETDCLSHPIAINAHARQCVKRMPKKNSCSICSLRCCTLTTTWAHDPQRAWPNDSKCVRTQYMHACMREHTRARAHTRTCNMSLCIHVHNVRAYASLHTAGSQRKFPKARW